MNHQETAVNAPQTEKYYQISIYPAKMLLRYVRDRHWTVGTEITATFHIFQEPNRRLETHFVHQNKLKDWVLTLARIEQFRVFIPEGSSICQTMLGIGAEAILDKEKWIFRLEETDWKWDQHTLKVVEYGEIATFVPAL